MEMEDEEAEAVRQFLNEVARLSAWENGLYQATCGCTHRFHGGDELPLSCLTHRTDVDWTLTQKL